MVITKREDVTKQGFSNKARFRGSLFIRTYSGELTQFGGEMKVGKWMGWGWALY